jgi:beta-lactamase class A
MTPATDLAIAYSLHDADGAALAERHGTEPFYAASTIKLVVMLATAIAIDRERASLGEQLACRRSFDSGVPGARPFRLDADRQDPEFPEDGRLVSIGELIRMMIGRSSNEATNLLVDRIGLAAISETIAVCGLQQTTMERRIGDLAADDRGMTNTVSTRDLAMVMRSIVTGRFTGPDTTAVMRGALAEQRHRRITTVLPDSMSYGSKSGEVPGFVHDVAFVGDPESDRVLYLAVCTRGFDEAHGVEIIAAVAESLLLPGVRP